MNDITLTPKQFDAVAGVVYWFHDSTAPSVFTIGGYAGVGKSTVVKYVAEMLDLPANRIAYATYTGKAALVLQRKGNSAQTIHRLIYKPKLASYLCPFTRIKKERVVGFELKAKAELDFDLIVIDEVSMVSRDLLDALLTFEIKILALGDPGQLPPVKGKPNGLLTNPDVFLEEVHRQAAENPIIWASMRIRKGEKIPYGQHGNNLLVIPKSDVTVAHIVGADQVICCTHEVRKTYNKVARTHYGYTSDIPVLGDKLICKKNNWKQNPTGLPLVNGLTVKVVMEPSRVNLYDRSFLMEVETEHIPTTRFYAVETNLDFFQPLPGQQPNTDGKLDCFDYGYAITTHASQGSAWDSVLCVGDYFGDPKTRRQLAYTQVTRAAEFCTLAI